MKDQAVNAWAAAQGARQMATGCADLGCGFSAGQWLERWSRLPALYGSWAWER